MCASLHSLFDSKPPIFTIKNNKIIINTDAKNNVDDYIIKMLLETSQNANKYLEKLKQEGINITMRD
jgi:hypothetical protein